MTSRWRFISKHRAEFGVKRLCRVLQVRRQGFYEWLAAAAARAEQAAAEEQLAVQITAIHREHRGAYGSLRVAAELRRRGRAVNGGADHAPPRDRGDHPPPASVADPPGRDRRTGAGPDRP